jgi:hypothetical protein
VTALRFKLTRSQVRPNLRGDYLGRKFSVEVVEKFLLPFGAGLSSGGSRETFELVRIQDGAAAAYPIESASPFDSGRRDRMVEIPLGFALRIREFFLGKDCGVRFVVGRCDAAAILPRGKLIPVAPKAITGEDGAA